MLNENADKYPEVVLNEPERYTTTDEERAGGDSSYLSTVVKIALPEDFVCETEEEKEKFIAGIRSVEVRTLYEYKHYSSK